MQIPKSIEDAGGEEAQEAGQGEEEAEAGPCREASPRGGGGARGSGLHAAGRRAGRLGRGAALRRRQGGPSRLPRSPLRSPSLLPSLLFSSALPVSRSLLSVTVSPPILFALCSCLAPLLFSSPLSGLSPSQAAPVPGAERTPLPRREEAADDDDEVREERPKKKLPKPDPEAERERLERTIFVGGVPVSNKQQPLIAHFSRYGKVESVRMRSIAFSRMSNPQMRKVGFIKGSFNPNQETCNAYIVFKEKASAEAALAENGKDDFAEGFHLRVDTAVEPTISHKKSIFVGNLAFTASEREVRQAFAEAGPIEYVRLVRDKVTSLGRGYAYVCFERREGAKAAAAMENVKVGNRVVRIERCKKPGSEKEGGSDTKRFKSGGGGGRGRGGGSY